MRAMLIALAVVLATITAHAGGTVTESWRTLGSMDRVVLTWTTPTNSASMSAATTSFFRGWIERVEAFAGPTVTPAYDVTLTSEGGVDLLAGRGANLATGTVSVAACVRVTDGTVSTVAFPAVNDQLTLAVASAGTNVTGTITVYLRQ